MLGFTHRVWRLLPRDVRRAGLTRGAALLAPRPGPPPAHSHGAVVAGDIAGRNGLAESARIIARALQRRGLLRGTVPLGLPGVVPRADGPPAADAAVIAVLNAPFLPVALTRVPRRAFAGRRMIGLWAWELPLTPPSWRTGARFVHDVWAMSPFTAAALEPLAPNRVRVVPFPLAEEAPPATEGTRADFGLPDDAFIVLTAFNLASSFARKNPLGAIAAFRSAFGASRDALLVLKLVGTEHYAADLAVIRAAVGDAVNIRLITDTLSEPRLQGLIAASDVVLSLHRAEGFGLILANACLLGKAAVATGFSGNLTFMTAAGSALVSYDLIPARDDRGVYALPGAAWAEPSVEDAAGWLRRLFQDAALRSRLGDQARAHAVRALDGTALDAAIAAAGIA